jgi:CDP-paratose 2-epimerase
VRDRAVQKLVKEVRPDGIVHCAAQPSHDLAASRVFEDFDVNAGGTLSLLQAAREFCPQSPFIHMSTNKVYGDAPNEITLVETETRWDYADPDYALGTPDTYRIDRASIRSLVPRGRSWFKNTGGISECRPAVFDGCLTGPNHAGVELHGFLSFLVRCNGERRNYKI